MKATLNAVPSPLNDPDVLDAILRSDFASFVHRCFCSLTPGTQFMPNWHIDALAYALEEVRLGRTTRLIVCMPPRSLKSIVASVAFPAFALGHDPTERIIAARYGAELAVKHANDFRAILGSGLPPALSSYAHPPAKKHRGRGRHQTQARIPPLRLRRGRSHRPRRAHRHHRRSNQAGRRAVRQQAREGQ